jgi:hypothetical protein
MDFLARIVVWLNTVANALGKPLLAPIGSMPEWLSAALVAAVTGVVLLIVFKYTSNQRAIKRVKDDIKANLLALKLFKDNAAVAARAQGRVFWGAVRLLVLAVVPILVMLVPVLLLLGQLGLWYQTPPLRVGNEAVVTLKLKGDAEASWPEVRLEPTNAIETIAGPVRVRSKREICWNVKALAAGYHHLVFHADGWTSEKEIAIGDGAMRVSTQRPGWDWWEALLNPWENPLDPDSPIQSIDIEYPKSMSWISFADLWVYYWFAVSMISALCFRGVLHVNL